MDSSKPKNPLWAQLATANDELQKDLDTVLEEKQAMETKMQEMCEEVIRLRDTNARIVEQVSRIMALCERRVPVENMPAVEFVGEAVEIVTETNPMEIVVETNLVETNPDYTPPPSPPPPPPRVVQRLPDPAPNPSFKAYRKRAALDAKKKLSGESGDSSDDTSSEESASGAKRHKQGAPCHQCKIPFKTKRNTYTCQCEQFCYSCGTGSDMYELYKCSCKCTHYYHIGCVKYEFPLGYPMSQRKGTLFTCPYDKPGCFKIGDEVRLLGVGSDNLGKKKFKGNVVPGVITRVLEGSKYTFTQDKGCKSESSGDYPQSRFRHRKTAHLYD